MAVEVAFRESSKHDQEEESLGRRAVKAGMWLSGLKVAHRGLGFVRTIILARILSPSDFGLFGIAVLTLNFLESFSATGINTALVQKKERINDYLDSAWTLNVIRSLLLFAILFLGASPVAHFFENPNALDVIRVLAFLQLIIGFENIGTVYFQKDIRFDRLFWLRFSSMIANVVVCITMALVLKSVWALVYGALVGALTRTVMSYLLHPYRPRLQFQLEKVRELLSFGKWVFSSGVLVYFITEGDDAFVGKVLGATALGFYQMAYQLSNAPATEISNFVAQITFPVYSKMQGDLSRLRETYLRVLQLVAFLSFPLSGLIFCLAPEFTRLILGEKWMPMVPAMQVLAVWGLIRAVGATTTQVFYSVGRPDLSTKVKLSQLILILAGIYPLTVKWGIQGTALAIVSATLIPNLAACYITMKIIEANLYEFSKMLVLPLMNTLAVFGIIIISRVWWHSNTALFVNILTGTLLYVCVTHVFNQFFGYDMLYVLRKFREGRRT